MLEFKSVEDILAFAIQKEETSYFFYTDVAAASEDPLTARLFHEIAQEEMKHRGQLQLEMMKMGRPVDVDKDWADRTIAEYVLEDGPPRDLTCPEALKLAMAKEHAAYRLYIDLIRASRTQEAVDVFMGLAEQEIRHKMRLEAAYENYMRQH